MNPDRIRRSAMAVLVLTAATSSAAAADPAQALRQYNQDRARCLGGESGQPRDTCMQEAAAAYAEARRGALGTAPASELARNATLRCEAQPPAEREACLQRIQGPADTEGSVGGGGILRRSVITEIR